MVTCKIKHVQKCFRAANFPRLCRGRKNVVKMFYFTCNHLLCSTCVQHAKTFAKHLQKYFSVLFYISKTFLQMFYFTCNHGLMPGIRSAQRVDGLQ